MGLRRMTVGRYEEIRRRLAEGRGVREIARALGCARATVREVRDGARVSPDTPRSRTDPLWMRQLEWPTIIHDLGLGHPLKFVWEEKAQHLTTYPNFWKRFYCKFPQYRQVSVTAREFEPGERAEVDYAGDAIEWVNFKTGEIRKAYLFVLGLGFNQLLFAWASEDMKYPKDKAVADGLVKILMRYMRFRYRHTRFISLPSINQALGECVERINNRRHTRFGVSRRERFETIEKSALKPLPHGDIELGDWKDATLHPDCYVYIEGDYYSAPHIHRHKKLRIKITENQVEIFVNLERLAIHPRSRHRNGKRMFIDAYFPPASQAYYEATPQKLLSQSRFIHPDLDQLFVELFNADIFGHLRRCQGFVRSCTKEINTAGHELASLRISAAIATMRRYNKFRVPYFQALLAQARKQTTTPDGDREIVRRPGNPMLRYVGGADQPTDRTAAIASTLRQENLKL